MRSKAHAPLREVVKETKAGYMTYMHGYRDTYNHRTANQFIWEQVGQRPGGDNGNDYANMHAFWRGMNRFRLSNYGKVFRQAEAVPQDYFQWLLPEDESKLGYLVDGEVLVLLNAADEPYVFEDIQLPKGRWRQIGTTEAINLDGIEEAINMNVELSKNNVLKVTFDGRGLGIWVNEK
jgi:hypothetical protein